MRPRSPSKRHVRLHFAFRLRRPLAPTISLSLLTRIGRGQARPMRPRGQVGWCQRGVKLHVFQMRKERLTSAEKGPPASTQMTANERSKHVVRGTSTCRSQGCLEGPRPLQIAANIHRKEPEVGRCRSGSGATRSYGRSSPLRASPRPSTSAASSLSSARASRSGASRSGKMSRKPARHSARSSPDAWSSRRERTRRPLLRPRRARHGQQNLSPAWRCQPVP